MWGLLYQNVDSSYDVHSVITSACAICQRFFSDTIYITPWQCLFANVQKDVYGHKPVKYVA